MSSTYNIFIFQKNRQTQCLRWLSAFFAYPSVENGIIYCHKKIYKVPT